MCAGFAIAGLIGGCPASAQTASYPGLRQESSSCGRIRGHPAANGERLTRSRRGSLVAQPTEAAAPRAPPSLPVPARVQTWRCPGAAGAGGDRAIAAVTHASSASKILHPDIAVIGISSAR